ncbi:MAG: hypothetical protein U1C56_02525 [Candidatus Curtissbacteria bacterium]|nr:hypothetical protein [Candidatus Nealsonbacteria bacterium]MDZ4210031.1 hypothetical protein [Candidatus Curtissbacteria bacterium]
MSEDTQQNKKLHPDVLKWIIIGLLVVVVIVLVLGAGIFIGEKKANFSYRWAEQYHKNFAGPRGGFFSDWQSFPRGDFIEGHGAFGEVIQIDDAGLVVKGRGDVEKVILTTQDTTIQKGRETIKKEELKIGDQIVIIGSPNEEGQIEAKLIRIFEGEPRPMPYKGPRVPLF